MRRTARLYLFAAAALAAATVTAPSSSAAPAAPAPAAVAGVTTVTGSKAAYVDVRVPRQAALRDPMFDEGRPSDVQISGDGRFVGFVLVSKDRKFVLYGGKIPEEFNKSKSFLRLHLGGEEVGQDVVVPAGDYRLYLLADGKPAKATLRLKGLTGTRALAPTRPADYQLTVPEPDVETSPRAVFAAGADQPVAADSLFLGFLGVVVEQHAASYLSNCYHIGEPEGPSPYTPPCADTGNTQPYFFGFPAQGEGGRFVEGLITTIGPVGAGHYGVGSSAITATPATTASYFHFWLGLTPKAAAKPLPAKPAAAPAPPAPAPAPARVRPAAEAPQQSPAAETLPSTGPSAALAPVAVLTLLAAGFARKRRSLP